jgi:hypothetical protein
VDTGLVEIGASSSLSIDVEITVFFGKPVAKP